MKWNFLYQITAASEPLTRGASAPRSPFFLYSVPNWICWTPPERNFWVRHWYPIVIWKHVRQIAILWTVSLYVMYILKIPLFWIMSFNVKHKICEDFSEVHLMKCSFVSVVPASVTIYSLKVCVQYINLLYLRTEGCALAQLVEALCYKLEGYGFDSQCDHCSSSFWMKASRCACKSVNVTQYTSAQSFLFLGKATCFD